MAILAIDTSMAACSAALLLPGKSDPIQRFEPMARGHAEALFPMIEAVMAAAGCGYDSLSKIAVTLGPGSFTGVRAGVAAARGLALAAHCPVIGANSLEVMARGCIRRIDVRDRSEGFAIVQDARRNECYLQCFDVDGGALSEPQAVPYSDAHALLPSNCRLIAGSGASTLNAADCGRRRTLRAVLHDLLPEAADLALLALSQALDERPPSPLYLRPPDAKPQADKSLVRAI